MAAGSFEASFANLLAVWVDYQLVPRRPNHVPELGDARWRLEQARGETRQARLGLRLPRTVAEPGGTTASPPEIVRARVQGMIGN